MSSTVKPITISGAPGSESSTGMGTSKAFSSIETVMKLTRISGVWPYHLHELEISRPWCFYSIMLLLIYVTCTATSTYGIITSLRSPVEVRDTGPIFCGFIHFLVASINIITSFVKSQEICNNMKKVKMELATRADLFTGDVGRGCHKVLAAFIVNIVVLVFPVIIALVVLVTGTESKLLLAMVAMTGTNMSNLTALPPTPFLMVGIPEFMALITDYSITFLISASVVALQALFVRLNREIKGSRHLSLHLIRHHLTLTKLFEDLNHFFGYFLMYFYTDFVVQLLIYGYTLIRTISWFVAYDITIISCYLIQIIFLAVCITRQMDCFHKQVHSIEQNLQEKLLDEGIPECRKALIERLYYRLRMKPIVFTVKDLFVINESFLLTILGIFTTYIVILIQLVPT